MNKLNHLFNKALYGSKIIGVEYAHFKDEVVITGLISNLKKGEFAIEETFLVEQLDQVAEHIPKGKSIVLNITGDNVLFKQINSIDSAKEEIIAEAYPNLDTKSFYYQIYQNETSSYVCVCRKKYVEELIASFEEKKLHVTQVVLGNLSLPSLFSIISSEELQTLSAKVTVKEGELVGIKKNKLEANETYVFDQEHVASTHLGALSSALNTLTNTSQLSSNFEQLILNLKSNYQQHSIFKGLLVGGIGFLLALLLINFFVFSSRYSTWQKLEEQKQLYENQQTQLKDRINDVRKKEALVSSILNSGFSKSSFFIDQLIQKQPQSITLTELIYQPVAKAIRKDKAINVEQKTIKLAGISTDKGEFNNWLQNLEILQFVTQTTILHYGTMRASKSEFEVLLNFEY